MDTRYGNQIWKPDMETRDGLPEMATKDGHQVDGIPNRWPTKSMGRIAKKSGGNTNQIIEPECMQEENLQDRVSYSSKPSPTLQRNMP